VQIQGVRDQTNFPNLTASTKVASIVSPTSFTIVIGSASTSTSYGGCVAINNGGTLLVGNLSTVVQSASVANGELTLIGLAAWAGILIGESCNAVGVFDAVTGAPLEVDGAYKVANINGTTLTLIPLPGTTLPSSLVSTNCGGAVIRRSEIRLHYVRVLKYDRQRVEVQSKASNDAAQSLSVTLTSGVTQAGVLNTGQPIPLAVVDRGSSALTTANTTAAIVPASGTSYQINIPVTAVTGTNPTLDVSIEESDDSGTNWYNVYTFPRITGVGIYRSPRLNINGNRIRYVQLVGGTTPSFTRSLNRQEMYGVVPEFRQMIDRAISLNVLNSVTTNRLVASNCSKAQLLITSAAGATVEAQVQLEGSDDNGLTWYAVGTPIATVASNTVSRVIDNIAAALLRARVSTAGTGAVLNNLLIKAYQ